MYKVAVVIPIYNGEKYLIEAIESVINQTQIPNELFLSDDASSDGSNKIIFDYSSRYEYITSISHSENIGLGRNIKNVLENTSSDFIVILGQDDYLPKNYISEISKSLDKNVSIIHTPDRLVDDKSNLLLKQRKISKFRFPIIWYLAIGNFISTVGIVLNVNMLKKFDSFLETTLKKKDGGIIKTYSEWLTWLELSKFGEIIYVSSVESYYRQHESNMSSTIISSKSEVEKNKFLIASKYIYNRGKTSYLIFLIFFYIPRKSLIIFKYLFSKLLKVSFKG